MKCVSKHLANICFEPIEVVGRRSETQLQVGENSNKLTWQDKGLW